MSDVKDAVKLDVITGPGRYPQRDGGIAVVSADILAVTCRGTNAVGETAWWFLDTGRKSEHREQPDDIIGPRIVDSLTDEEAARYARAYVTSRDGKGADPYDRIASLEAHNAALQTELDSLRAIMDSEHETFLQELILTAYGNAPFGTDHAKVVADAKAMLRTMEGGAV